MSLTDSMINAQYEYRIANIVRSFLIDNYKLFDEIKTGDELEEYLSDGISSAPFLAVILDDIAVWTGFDELLKQVKGE